MSLLLCALTLLDEGLGELVFPLHADDVAHNLHPLWGHIMERLESTLHLYPAIYSPHLPAPDPSPAAPCPRRPSCRALPIRQPANLHIIIASSHGQTGNAGVISRSVGHLAHIHSFSLGLSGELISPPKRFSYNAIRQLPCFNSSSRKW